MWPVKKTKPVPIVLEGCLLAQVEEEAPSNPGLTGKWLLKRSNLGR